MNFKGKSAPTSSDVARQAGVSQSAVSLVFGGKANGRVGKQTERAIRKAAHGLGYRPNSAAQALRLGRSRRLVFAVPDIENPYFAGTLKGAEREAAKHGFSVALATVREAHDWESVIVDALVSGSVDGFALFVFGPPTTKLARALVGKAILVDASSRNFPSVRLDIEGGMRAAMRHLLELRHTRIGHLAAAVDAETFSVRKSIYLDSMRSAHLTVRDAWQAEAQFELSAAAHAAHAILSGSEPPTAIVCDSDVLAAGVYKAAKALRLSIPGNLSVVSIDDSLIARIVDPPLTTIAIPAGRVGEQAVHLLLELLHGAAVSDTSVIPLEIVVRESTARLREYPETTILDKGVSHGSSSF